MKQKRKIALAIIGTDSLRGNEIKNVLSRKKIPLASIDFFDPDVREEYSKLSQFRDEPKVIYPLQEDSINGMDLVLLAADKKINREYGILAQKKKIRAIDLSETFNSEEKVPVVVAGVNDHIIQETKPGLIANPHPVTIILSHISHLIKNNFGLKKVLAFILQSASAFEKPGIEELADQSVAMLSSKAMTKKVFKTQAAFNLLCQTEPLGEDGFSAVEKQILSEMRRIFDDKSFPLSLSIVQAPVFHTYSIMIYLELEKKASIQNLTKLFKESSYFKFSSPALTCPASSVSVAGKDEIFIGSIKREESFPNGYWIWAVADNLIRGSALNAYEIAEKIFSP